MKSYAFHAFLLVAFLIFSCIQTGSSLRCYSCSESTTSKCMDPFESSADSTLHLQCENKDEVCVKHKQPSVDLKIAGVSTQSFKTNIIRGCKSVDYCKTVGNFSLYCSTCKIDDCNTSTIATPSIIFVVLAAMKSYFI